MRWQRRAVVWARATLRDLFGEGDEAQHSDPLGEQLAQTQARLGDLQQALGEAQARARRAELAWQSALAWVAAQEVAADAALRAGQESAARAAQEQARQGQSRAVTLAGDYQAARQAAERLQAELADLQRRFAGLQAECARLAERERSVAALEELAAARRELVRQAAGLQADVAQRSEQVSRRVDRLEARAELERDSRKGE